MRELANPKGLTEGVRNQNSKGKREMEKYDLIIVGAAVDDVIAALIDLEDAEINAVGDCMSGCCMMQPKFEDFVRTGK